MKFLVLFFVFLALFPAGRGILRAMLWVMLAGASVAVLGVLFFNG